MPKSTKTILRKTPESAAMVASVAHVPYGVANVGAFSGSVLNTGLFFGVDVESKDESVSLPSQP